MSNGRGGGEEARAERGGKGNAKNDAVDDGMERVNYEHRISLGLRVELLSFAVTVEMANEELDKATKSKAG